MITADSAITPPHHICMVVPSFDRIGGYERQAFSMAKAFNKAGKRAFILTENLGRLPCFEVMEGVEVIRFYPVYQHIIESYAIYLRKLFAFDFAGMLDVVHCHAFDFLSGWAIQQAQRYRIPTLVKIATERDITQYSEHIANGEKAFGDALHNLKQCDRFISLNGNISKELRNIDVEDQSILEMPNGVDSDLYTPVSEPEKLKLKQKLQVEGLRQIITYTGRFEERKRVRDLIEAFALVADDLPEAHLVLIGAGDEQADCEALASQCKAAKRIHFKGACLNVHEWLKVTDLYVFPSRLEGMPNAVLEAMSSALPVIGSSITGIIELITEGQNGWMVPPMQVPALAERIKQVMMQPQRRASVGRQAREYVLKTCSFDGLVQRYLEIYGKLMEQKA